MVIDPHYKKQIPVNVYLRDNVAFNENLVLGIVRYTIDANIIDSHKLDSDKLDKLHFTKHKFSINLVPVPDICFNNVPVSTTNCQVTTYLPHLNIGGIILIDLSMELIVACAKQNIKIDTIAAPGIIVIDCTHASLRKKYHLPQMINNTTIQCPRVVTINQQTIDKIDNVTNLSKVQCICLSNGMSILLD